MGLDSKSISGLAHIICDEREPLYLNPPRRNLLHGMLILNIGTTAIVFFLLTSLKYIAVFFFIFVYVFVYIAYWRMWSRWGYSSTVAVALFLITLFPDYIIAMLLKLAVSMILEAVK